MDGDELGRLAYRARIANSEYPDIQETIQSINLEGFADGPTADGSIWSIALALPASDLQIPLVLGLAGPAETVKARRRDLHTLMVDAIGRWLTVTPGI